LFFLNSAAFAQTKVNIVKSIPLDVNPANTLKVSASTIPPVGSFFLVRLHANAGEIDGPAFLQTIVSGTLLIISPAFAISDTITSQNIGNGIFIPKGARIVGVGDKYQVFSGYYMK
jgi:hypothetical protein